jgi:hypothetical protein
MVSITESVKLALRFLAEYAKKPCNSLSLKPAMVGVKQNSLVPSQNGYWQVSRNTSSDSIPKAKPLMTSNAGGNRKTHEYSGCHHEEFPNRVVMLSFSRTRSLHGGLPAAL